MAWCARAWPLTTRTPRCRRLLRPPRLKQQPVHATPAARQRASHTSTVATRGCPGLQPAEQSLAGPQNVTNQFSRVGEDPRLRFFGNVRVGSDIGLAELRKAHHAVRARHCCCALLAFCTFARGSRRHVRRRSYWRTARRATAS